MAEGIQHVDEERQLQQRPLGSTGMTVSEIGDGASGLGVLGGQPPRKPSCFELSIELGMTLSRSSRHRAWINSPSQRARCPWKAGSRGIAD